MTRPYGSTRGSPNNGNKPLSANLSGLEHLGDLAGAEAEHVTQHQDPARPRRQISQPAERVLVARAGVGKGLLGRARALHQKY